ncbi:MAG TPA: DUF2231 domain-containing protein [Steroidobacteraceae bacterium]|nr:DUF2231 domain-containing protein [Steroidobacteraceae bacterium]
MRIRLAGHPIHPMVVHFPIALWTVGVAADAGGWIWRDPIFWTLSFYAQALGDLAGAAALVTGWLEFTTILRATPAQDAAVGHMLVMCSAWVAFLLSLALRTYPPRMPSTVWPSVIAAAGWLTMAVGGWLGGKLVYRFAVGVTRPIEP